MTLHLHDFGKNGLELYSTILCLPFTPFAPYHCQFHPTPSSLILPHALLNCNAYGL